jgi:hypothetical protein
MRASFCLAALAALAAGTAGQARADDPARAEGRAPRPPGRPDSPHPTDPAGGSDQLRPPDLGLHESIERLAEAWRAQSPAVVVDKARFLVDESDERHPLMIPIPELPEGECTTVALLGSRGLSFHVRWTEGGEDEPKRIPSVAGALSLERCAGTAPPRRLIVSSDSGRGTIETIVARSSNPLPSLRTVLPERAGASLAAGAEPGTLPPLPAPERRAEIAELRAKRDGASVEGRASWRAGIDGTGAAEETLGAGCHSLELFALDPRAAHPNRRGKLDLDAEMRDLAGDRLLARDRTDAPDALLAACVGEPTQVGVVFAGSPPGASVLVTHVAWQLPAHLPDLWGNEARARMAHVLLARHVVSLPRAPALLAEGGSGITSIPLSIEPGGCYLAVATLVREAARTIGVRVRVGGFSAADDRGVDDDGAAVAFCAGNRESALADVEARGTPLLGWGFALYRLQAGVWGQPQ